MVGEERIDIRTGRPFGDHGTGSQAIDWILNNADFDSRCQAEEFLIAWQEGDLDEWPEFYEWLATSHKTPTPSSVEPYGYAFQHEETGHQQVVDIQQVEWGFEENNPRWQKLGPVFLHDHPSASPNLRRSAKEFLTAVERLLDWMNGNDLSADYADQRPKEFEPLGDSLVVLRNAIDTTESSR